MSVTLWQSDTYLSPGWPYPLYSGSTCFHINPCFTHQNNSSCLLGKHSVLVGILLLFLASSWPRYHSTTEFSQQTWIYSVVIYNQVPWPKIIKLVSCRFSIPVTYLSHPTSSWPSEAFLSPPWWEILTNLDELSFFTVFAFPNASKMGLAWSNCCSNSPCWWENQELFIDHLLTIYYTWSKCLYHRAAKIAIANMLRLHLSWILHCQCTIMLKKSSE